VDLLGLLIEFLYRLSGGLAAAMALTSPRLVTSGFFRNHLYVTLGLNVLAALIAWGQPDRYAVWPATAAAVLSYLGAVCWLYEQSLLGRLFCAAVSVCSLAGAMFASQESLARRSVPLATNGIQELLWRVEPFASAWLLGFVFAAMLLGHWYLNAPGMKLEPLKTLHRWAFAGTLLRGAFWACCLTLEWQLQGHKPGGWPFWSLHGGAGILGTLAVLVMSWETLKIPNTQSATGILYVGVILTFLGEVAGLLISRETMYPL
jgi:hypothetical protein